MKVINLFGQPGAGKSTTAAGLFFLLKSQGVNCELIAEYAKDMTWRQMHPDAFRDQLYIFAKQSHRLERLRGKVDFAITDSPLLLSHVYLPDGYFPSFSKLVDEVWKSYDNESFFLHRTKAYSPVGRSQTEEESNKIAEIILDVLGDKTSYYQIRGDKNAPEEILNILL